jgi:agmatinase
MSAIHAQGGIPVTPRTSPIPIGRPSFLDAPRCAALDRLDADLAVIGVPYTTPHDLPRSRAGSSRAPETVREQSQRFAGRATHYDFDLGGDLFAGRRVQLVDCGDVWAAPGQYESNARNVTAVVAAVLARRAVPIVLGGDHAATIPTVLAYTDRGPVCAVHLGAELDWQDEVNGVRSGPCSAMRRIAELPWVTSMMQVGLRGSGSARRRDVDDADAFGSVLVRAEELHEVGVPAILRRLPPAPSYYISLDAAALDPAIAPGVETPAFGGLTYFEATNLLRGIAATAPVIGLDVVGIVPTQDLHDMTSLLAARLVLNLVGALAQTGRIGTGGGEGTIRQSTSPRTALAAADGPAPVGALR